MPLKESEIIVLKSPDEIEKMRDSNIIVAEILANIKEAAKPGITTLELEGVCEVKCFFSSKGFCRARDRQGIARASSGPKLWNPWNWCEIKSRDGPCDRTNDKCWCKRYRDPG